MKKNLLLFGFVITNFYVFSQQTIYSASDLVTFSQWTFLDSDGDGWNWEVDDIPSYEGLEFQGALIKSFSLQPYNFDPLTPDNYAYSIPVSSEGYENLSLRFKRLSTGVITKHEEHYSVYAISATSSANLEIALLTATPLYTETIEVGRTLEERTVDLSFLDGMDSIYIVFRHYNCTDEFFMIIDDVILEGNTSSASIADYKEQKLSVFPQPMNNSVTLSTEEEIASIVLIDQSGKIVIQEINLATNKYVLNTQNLSKGVYFLKVQTSSGAIYTQKCVK